MSKLTKINLGDTCKDTISGFEGVCIARTEWLNGCVRVTIAPQKLHEGKLLESCCFDVEQVELVKAAPPREVKPTGGPNPAPTRNRDPSR